MGAADVFWTFLKLGCTSFGGPSAHLGYFRTAFVQRLGWLSEARYAELVALGQFLPGPASSQVGFAIGLERAGAAGGAAAWAGFTLPSALIMLAAAFGLDALPAALLPGVVQGLKLVAVAVVLHAVLGMAETLCRDRVHRLLGVGALVLSLLMEGVAGQLAALVLAGLAAFFAATPAAAGPSAAPAPKRVGSWPFLLIGCAIALLLVLPFARPLPVAAIAEPFYRAGSLVFGGGHVVLPFLESATVGQGGLPTETFLAGYGIAQAIPGPLFTFAAYLGAASHGIAGGVIALVAIFAPGLLLMAGALPLWTQLSHKPGLRRALGGVNAAVVGILGAALYDPLWTTAVHGTADVAAVAVGWAMLQVLRWPPWTVALAGLAYGLALATL
ncbi:MAG: chromate efflux transporter [Alphaproteobacteria bacterium]|nr:chromate efflux transporter [Alphaproteobacteria bacterium]